MEEKTLVLKDKLNQNDDILTFGESGSMFRKTRIMGYNELGEKMFDAENQIVLGGALFTLEKLFGVQSPLLVDYLNNFLGVANSGITISEVYPKDTVVCLFGVGTGGCGDSMTSVQDVHFYEREIINMVPLRASLTPLSSTEQQKYWFRKTLSSGHLAYYLKNFELTPQIKVLWKDGVGDADGSEVQSGVHNTTRTDPIETFVELTLKITKDDVREWFQINGNTEQTRINSIGLFTGIKGTLADGSTDYKQVKLFSKLNISNEMLTLAKDLTIVYRIYTS